jgi:hypothetical protein
VLSVAAASARFYLKAIGRHARTTGPSDFLLRFYSFDSVPRAQKRRRSGCAILVQERSFKSLARSLRLR